MQGIRELSFDVKNQMVSLSERIRSIRRDNHYLQHDKYDYFDAKNKYNLPIFIFKIIKKTTIPDLSPKSFGSAINKYNKENKTSIKLDDYLNECTVRIVNNEIRLPSVIRGWIQGITEDAAKIEKFSCEKKHFFLCLAGYYKNYYINSKPYITGEEMQKIIEELHIENDPLRYLLDNNVIMKKEDEDAFILIEEHYPLMLNNEIVAMLWIQLSQGKTVAEDFSHFLRILHRTHLILDEELSIYLSGKDREKLSEQIIEYILHEDDIKNSKNEIKKIVYDSERFTHHPTEMTIPDLVFSGDNPYDMIKNIERHYNFEYFKNYMLMSDARKEYYMLIKYIINHEISQNCQYYGEGMKKTMTILTDLTRPFLIFEVLFIIKRSCPEAIPYLLTEPCICPLIIKTIDEFEIKENYFENTQKYGERYERQYALRSQIYMDCLSIIYRSCIETYKTDDVNTNIISNMTNEIFFILSRQCLQLFYNAHPYTLIDLNYKFNRYKLSLNFLKELKINTGKFNGITELEYFFHLIAPACLANIMTLVKNSPKYKASAIYLPFEYFDVAIDFMRTVNNMPTVIKWEEESRYAYMQAEKQITFVLAQKLCFSLDTSDITLNDQSRFRIWSDFSISQIDTIDWRYFFILLKKHDFLSDTINKMISNINVGCDSEYYSDENHIESDKIKRIIHIFLLAYVSIQTDHDDIDTVVGTDDIIFKLTSIILQLSVVYSVNRVKDKRLDCFDDDAYPTYNKKHNTSIALLFSSLNYIDKNKQLSFINDFFNHSNKLDRMLIALNIVSDSGAKNLIYNFINQIQVSDFIDSCYFITNIEDALFEALNDEKLCTKASELLNKVKEHYENRKISDAEINAKIYQAELLLAFHSRDIKAIQKVEFKKDLYYLKEFKLNGLKEYYEAMHFIDHCKDYGKAYDLLKRLVSQNETNFRFQLLFLKASMFAGFETNDEFGIINSFKQWISFLDKADEGIKQIASRNQDIIEYYLIPYYIVTNNIASFDNAIENSKDEWLFTDIMMKHIYELYQKAGMIERAFGFIEKAAVFFQNCNMDLPTFVEKIINNPTERQIAEKKRHFEAIVTTSYQVIPKITPENINENRNLETFILAEFLQALKQMFVKIKSVQKLKYEDNYSDMLESILSLRFPFYGWEIMDNVHSGISESGIGPGEPDLVIKSSNKVIAIAEAIKLCGKETDVISSHIKKIRNYDANLNRYYMLIYYTGIKERFNETWQSYTEVFKTLKFNEDEKPLFIDGNFFFKPDIVLDNSNLFIVKKTNHTKFEMYHIFVDFSSE